MKWLKLTSKQTVRLMRCARLWDWDIDVTGHNIPDLQSDEVFADHVAMRCLRRLQAEVSPALMLHMKDIDEGDPCDWVCARSSSGRGRGGNTPTEAIFREALRWVKIWERTDKQMKKHKRKLANEAG